MKDSSRRASVRKCTMPRRVRVLVLASAALASAKKPLMPKCEDQADDIGASICQAMLAVGF